MKLEKIIIENFRCYQFETEFVVDNLNCLIGTNDVGKSTILEALDAFFNDNIDSSDLSTNAQGNEIKITCEFSGIPEKVILDTSIKTSPLEEGILNEKGNLEVERVFKIGATVSKSIFLNANNYIDGEIQELLTLKNDSLKHKAKILGIDLKGFKTKNPPIREAIRNHFKKDKAASKIKVEGNLTTENNLKTIWGKLNSMMPIYSLFKVDKDLNDKDSNVQDPMKSAIQETLAIKDIQEKLEEIEELVRIQSSAVADEIIKKLSDIDESLAETLKSDLRKAPSWKSVFDLTLLNDQGIPLNKRGSGVRRLVLLSFFQAQAEKRKADKGAPSIIYAIEEPETSQHPNHQMLLIKSLIDLSEAESTQVFFTSHSANLVKEIPVKSLRHIVNNAGILTIENAWNHKTGLEINGTINAIIETLGILPNPKDSVKVLIYVEGNNDVLALKRYSTIFEDDGNDLADLNDKKIGWVITGGSSLKHYVDNHYLSGLGKPEIHLYDGDKPEYIHIVATINAENSPTKKAFNTSRLELENYLHPQAINEAYQVNGILCQLEVIEEREDIPTFVAEHIYALSGNNWNALEPDKQKKKSDEKKKLLNTVAVEKMSLDRLKESGGYEEIRTWLVSINTMSNS